MTQWKLALRRPWVSCGLSWKYIYACTLKLFGILEVKELRKSVYCVKECAICRRAVTNTILSLKEGMLWVKAFYFRCLVGVGSSDTHNELRIVMTAWKWSEPIGVSVPAFGWSRYWHVVSRTEARSFSVCAKSFVTLYQSRHNIASDFDCIFYVSPFSVKCKGRDIICRRRGVEEKKKLGHSLLRERQKDCHFVRLPSRPSDKNNVTL